METIKTVLTKMLEDLETKNQKDPLFFAWKKVADRAMQQHAYPHEMKRKTLRIIADSSAWAYELNLKKRELLEKFKAQGLDINNITLRVGRVN